MDLRGTDTDTPGPSSSSRLRTRRRSSANPNESARDRSNPPDAARKERYASYPVSPPSSRGQVQVYAPSTTTTPSASTSRLPLVRTESSQSHQSGPSTLASRPGSSESRSEVEGEEVGEEEADGAVPLSRKRRTRVLMTRGQTAALTNLWKIVSAHMGTRLTGRQSSRQAQIGKCSGLVSASHHVRSRCGSK
jgi:hypothetical protein